MRRGIAAVALGVTLVVLVAALQWRPIVRMLAEERLAASTGCAVRVTGPVGLSPGLTSEVRLATIAFTSREGSPAACRGKLAGLELWFRLWGLRLEKLDLRGGEVQLGNGDATAALVLEGLSIRPGAGPETLAAELSGQLEHASLRTPVEATATLETEGDLGVSDLDLRLGSRERAWLELVGNAARVFPPEAFELSARFGWKDVRELAPLVGAPPDIGPVEGSLVVHDRSGALGIHDFTLKGGRSGVFEIDAEGSFEDVRNLHGLDARLDLKARDLSVLGELARTPLPAAGPVAFSGSIAGRKRRFRVDDLALDVGESRLSGTFSADLPEAGRPRLEARIDAKPLRLSDVGIEPHERTDVAGSTAADAWSDRPFGLDWLRRFDARLVARAEDVRGVNGALLQETSFEGELEGGRLSLRHVSLAVDGGRVTGELRSDASLDPPTFGLEADFRGIELSRLLEQIEKSNAYSGSLHGRLELNGHGASPRALARSLAGELTAVSPGGSIATEYASLLTRDFFSALRPLRRRKSEVVNCLVVDVGLAAGVGTIRSWVLDTADLVVLGEGQVDLAAGRFDLRFVPKPRNASPLSTAATIRVTGPFSDPTVRTEKTSLLTSTGKALLGTLPWLSRSRGVLRQMVGAGGDFARCRELLGDDR